MNILKRAYGFGFFSLFFLLTFGVSPVFAQDIFWSTPAKISQSTNLALRPVVASDSQGYVHAVWLESATNPFLPSTPRPTAGILYSFWNGDTWSTPQQINIPARGAATSPSITITPNNDIHVVWGEDIVGEETWDQIWYTRYSAGSWSTPISISGHQTLYSWEWTPVITSDSSGNLYVIFAYSNTDLSGAYLYYTKYNGSTWSTPTPISQGLTQVQVADLAVDSSGNVHVLMWDWNATGGIFYAYYNGSSWSSLQQLKTSEASFPKLTIDGANNLHAAWVTFNSVGKNYSVEYARKASGSPWGSPFVVSTTVANPWWGYPLTGLTVDNNNDAYVGWGQYNTTPYPDMPGRYGVDAMHRKYTVSTDNWSAPNLVRSTKMLDAPTIWRDKWWNQHFVWSEMDPSTNQWQFWYSEVPANSGSYSPSSNFSLTMTVTNDTLDIPRDSLANAATISAQVGPVPASRDPLVTTIPRSYTFRPHGTTFLPGKVATATIRYTDAEILGSNESQLKVYMWDATANSGLGGWTTSFTTGVNAGANRITAELPHFSLYGIMAPRAEREMVLTWKPPISNSDLYSMVDGSTLPIKFTLNYADGASVATPTSAEEMIVYIRNAAYLEDEVSALARFEEFHFGSAESDVRFDSVGKQYLLNLRTKDLNLGPGVYYIKVAYQGITVGAINFQITEPGKVKGITAP